MRILVFLLVLANLLFFAYAQGYFGGTANPDGERLRQQFQPDKVRIVGRGETAPGAAPPPASEGGEGAADKEPAPEAATKPEAAPRESKPEPAPRSEAKPAPERCLAWGGMTPAQADKLAVLAKARSGLKANRSSVVEAATHWVFIPALASRQDAERKADELKRLEVPEFFIVQEPGPQRNAISLGIFSTEQAARDRLEELRGKGVRSARVGPRAIRSETVRIELKGPEDQLDALRKAAGRPLADIHPAACGDKSGRP